ANFFFNDAVVSLLLIAGDIQRLTHNLPCVLHQSIFTGGKAAGHDFRLGLHASRKFVDGDNRQHDAVFADMAPILDDQVFDYVGARARVDAYPANIDPSDLARAEFVEFQDVSALDEHDVADGTMHRRRQFRVQFQLAIFAMNGDKVARLDQVNNQLQFFLAGVPADVDGRRRAVFVDHVRFAPKEVIDHPVNGFLISGDDARGQHYGVALLDLGVLVIVHCRPRHGGHGFTLRPADQYANLLRGKVLHLPGMNQQAVRNLDVAQVFRDLGGTGHGAPDESYFPSMLPGQFDRQLDAMYGRRKAGDKEPLFSSREHLVELPPHRALAGRVAPALHVRGILKQRQHSFFAVLGKRVQVKQLVVRGRGIDLEVAGVNNHP